MAIDASSGLDLVARMQQLPVASILRLPTESSTDEIGRLPLAAGTIDWPNNCLTGENAQIRANIGRIRQQIRGFMIFDSTFLKGLDAQE